MSFTIVGFGWKVQETTVETTGVFPILDFIYLYCRTILYALFLVVEHDHLLGSIFHGKSMLFIVSLVCPQGTKACTFCEITLGCFGSRAYEFWVAELVTNQSQED